MRTLLSVLVVLVVLLLWGAARPAEASTPVVGQSVLYHAPTGGVTYVAIVAGVWGPGEADLIILNSYWIGGLSFGFGLSSRYDWPTTYLTDVSEGTTANRWESNPAIGLGQTGATGPGALVTSTSSPTLALGGAAVQFSNSHDVEYTVVVKIAVAITLTTGAAGHVDLVCDSSGTPTTIRDTASTELTGTLVVGANLVHSSTQTLRWRVPVADSCKLTSTNDTGTPTYTLVRQFAQVLG